MLNSFVSDDFVLKRFDMASSGLVEVSSMQFQWICDAAYLHFLFLFCFTSL